LQSLRLIGSFARVCIAAGGAGKARVEACGARSRTGSGGPA